MGLGQVRRLHMTTRLTGDEYIEKMLLLTGVQPDASEGKGSTGGWARLRRKGLQVFGCPVLTSVGPRAGAAAAHDHAAHGR